MSSQINFKLKKISVLVFLFYYLCFSGLFIVLLYSVTDLYDWYLIKDGVVILLLGLLPIVGLKRSDFNIVVSVSPILIVITYAYLLSNADLFSQVASLRQLLMPFLLIVLGALFTKSKADYYKLTKVIIPLIFIILIFGLIERFLLIWQYIDISNFFTIKNIFVYDFGYPFYWIEPISVLGYMDFDKGIARMVSTIMDPVNLGHILVFFFVFVLYEKSLKVPYVKKSILLLLIFISLLLTFSKGAFLQLFLILIIFNERYPLLLKLMFIILVTPVIVLYIAFHPGFMIHLNGFINIFNHVSLFGSGLASFGNYAAMFNPEYIATGVGDSYWASLIGQFGIVGFAVWGMIFIAICSRVGKTHYLAKIFFSQILVSALSENAFNLMSIAFAGLFLGSYYKTKVMSKMMKCQLNASVI